MPLLTPTSIAVIGASATPGKVGHEILKNILTEGFQGAVYPVNPKGGEILGKKAYTTVKKIPGEVDLALIVTPAETVLALIQECNEKKIENVIVISAGFGETGKAGAQEEFRIGEFARTHGIRLIGVNCLGLLRPSIGLNASFATDLPPSGNIALISQSGALAVALIDQAKSVHLGCSFVVSIGNKTVLDECDLLETALGDPETQVIGLYLESITHGQRFRDVAAKVIAAGKPIVLLKSGTSQHGKQAVSSHTGALAGSDAGIAAVCSQTGVHRAGSLGEFTDILRAVSTQPALPSANIAVITNAGGPGILATDAAEEHGLNLPPLTEVIGSDLRTKLPPAASVRNPIDVLGDADATRYSAAIGACVRDPGIDGVILLLTPQVMTPSTEIAKAIVAAKKKTPLLPMVASFMGEANVREAVEELERGGIPVFPTPERAVAAIAALRLGTAADSEPPPPAPKGKGSSDFLKNRTGLLDEETTQSLLEQFSLPLPQYGLAKNEDEAIAIAERIHFPIVAKISSPQILHKTDVGGIRVNLKTPDDVRTAFREIKANVAKNAPQADVRGVLIQQFLPVGDEFIVGGLRDPSFGPLIMVGLGGIYTELFKDTVFRLAPVTEREAYAMLQSLKSWPVLLGLRGKAKADIAELAETIVKASQLMAQNTEIRELDFNPVLVGSEGIVIADAKVIL